MSVRVAILGTGGNCVDLMDTLLDINRQRGQEVYTPVGFLDDNPALKGKTISGLPVLGPLSQAAQMDGCQFINGIGSTATYRAKEKIIGSCQVPHARFLTLIHPTAHVSNMARLSPGVAILQNATVTSNVVINEHVIVLPNSVISHDNEIGAYSCVAGGACLSGHVVLQDHVYIGSGALVRQCVHIGAGALIGMGAVVLRDVDPDTVMVGNPARVMRRIEG
jgi:sugar O-acyltransferase (sialic acid O-acetyltransferase NeuD family)